MFCDVETIALKSQFIQGGHMLPMINSVESEFEKEVSVVLYD